VSTPAPIVAFEAVDYGYVEGGRRHPVLHGVAGRVEYGETVALLGRSGSGKSSLLNLVAGLAAPDAGRIHVAGCDLRALSEAERTRLRRRRIGFVYQFFNLIATLSVLDNVVLPLDLDGRGGGGERVRAERLLTAVGLEHRRDARPDALSGGEQQRVALARALAPAPALVLADEPTGNLDRETGARVLDLLVELAREAGHALLLVTHSPEVAARADRVLHLEDGQLDAPP
jgi:putative ABC transport system ATP-binding protein